MRQVERIQALLRGKGILADVKNEGTEVMAFIATGVVGSRLVVAERNGLLRCSVLISISCPDYLRTDMAVAISRANWGLNGGSFRMDSEDGELRYEVCFPVFDSEPTEAQLEWLLFATFSA